MLLTADGVLSDDDEGDGSEHGEQTGASAASGSPHRTAMSAADCAEQGEPSSHVAPRLLAPEERAARYVRRLWPVLLHAPLRVLLEAVGVTTAEYGAWLEQHGLRLPASDAIGRVEARQRQKAEAEAEAQAAAVA
jgi:hypothetical protein